MQIPIDAANAVNERNLEVTAGN